MIILGIDPGSRVTGFGIISWLNRRVYYVDSGCICTATQSFFSRLKSIYQGVEKLIIQYNPDEVAIEKVFMARNPDSALKLGQARGVAIVAAMNHKVAMYEYSARQIKQAVVGNGNADKIQVQHMVSSLLALNNYPKKDAADALATALCHIQYCAKFQI